MIKDEDLKYCKVNEASKDIFPTYFLFDLKLTKEQKKILNDLIRFLTSVKTIHTPPPPQKPCPECGNTPYVPYMDTWDFSGHVFLAKDIEFYRKLLEPHRISGDHT